MDSRHKIHHDAINFCQAILQQKSVEWKAVLRNNLSQPINDVDLVVTIGVDGTLLRGRHFMDNKIPVLGVNSDPTRIDEVHISYGFGFNIDILASEFTIYLISFFFLICQFSRWKSSVVSLMLPEALAIFVLQQLKTLNK